MPKNICSNCANNTAMYCPHCCTPSEQKKARDEVVALKEQLAAVEHERDRLKRSTDNPFCQNCQESDCLVSTDGKCAMLRVYLRFWGMAESEENTKQGN